MKRLVRLVVRSGVRAMRDSVLDRSLRTIHDPWADQSLRRRLAVSHCNSCRQFPAVRKPNCRRSTTQVAQHRALLVVRRGRSPTTICVEADMQPTRDAEATYCSAGRYAWLRFVPPGQPLLLARQLIWQLIYASSTKRNKISRRIRISSTITSRQSFWALIARPKMYQLTNLTFPQRLTI